MDEFLEQHMQRQILRYAVGRTIQCQSCGNILDCRSACLITLSDERVCTLCSACSDTLCSCAMAKGLDISDVIDGRKLWGEAKPRVRAPRKKFSNRACLIACLERDGYGIRAKTRLYDVYDVSDVTRTEFYYVGRSGALRSGRTVAGSVSLTDTRRYAEMVRAGEQILQARKAH